MFENEVPWLGVMLGHTGKETLAASTLRFRRSVNGAKITPTTGGTHAPAKTNANKLFIRQL
jgi:hypothetical protein